ncbi:MAG: EamA family transporter [Planctomycetota bacterium]|nr:EamA family transporter [Planctomycetota bacterium]
MNKLLASSTTITRQPLSSHSAALWGTIYGAITAVGYTAANICLRSVTDCDPVWVSCIKTIPTVVGVAPWLIVRWSRGERVFPPLPIVATLLAAGLLGQFGGNVVFQWALGIIGIALTVPLCMGMIIIASAVLGRILLHESVTSRTAAALAVLLAAIWILSLGAQGLSDSTTNLETASPWLVTAAVTAGCVAGFSYSVLGVTIRRAVLGVSTVSATTFCVAIVGLVSLTPLTVYRIGVTEMIQTDRADLAMMVLAGVFNLIAFLALTRALQITSLVYVNALNASQVAMASVAGIVLFQEQASPALTLGVSLTVVGLLIMPRHKRIEEPASTS